MSVIIFVVASLILLQQPAEGRECRHPRPLRHGRYEYQRSRDHVDASHLPEGYVVRVICRPYARRFGDEYIVCQDNGKWSSRSFCRGAVICRSTPPVPENGYVRVRGRSSGSIALYGCNPGFQMVGSSTTFCDVNTSSWHREAPICIRPPSCPAPTALPEKTTVTMRTGTGHLVDTLYTEQSVLKYTCVYGYFPSSDVNITCQLDGAWIPDGEVPECIEIYCRPPTMELIEHGTSNIVDRDYKISEEVHYTCDIGYRLDGRSWQVCRQGDGPVGVWTERVPRCRVVQCPDPGPLHLDGDGHVSFSSRDRRLGTVMNLRCSSRLTLLGSSERVCQPNGLWNGTLTSCNTEENYCPALGNPIHGTKVAPYSFNLNSVVQFKCLTGTNDNGDPLFELVGSHERRCTVTGEWSGEMPRCMARDEFDNMDKVTAVMGETFDELEIDGNYLSPQRDHDNRINFTSRRKRSIDLSNKSGLDIIFAFDGSGSIGNESFSKGKEFAKLLVKKVFVNLNPGGARVAALVYATDVNVVFHLDHYNDTESVVNAIEGQVQNENKGTNLPKALITIRDEVLPISLESPNNRRVLFIITDGLNNMGGEPIKDAQRLKELKVAIHCIGVSQNVSKDALNSIASDPKGEHIFFLHDYWDLEHAVNNVTQTNRSYDKCGVAGLKSPTRGEVRLGRWPWQAAIYAIDPNIEYDEGTFGCGGSLIDKEWVLTAAHCLRNVTKRELAVYLGLTVRDVDIESSRSQRYEVNEMIIHPDFRDDGSYYNDIALLRLDHEAQLNAYVRTICLPPDQVLEPNRARALLNPTRNMARVIGWGYPQPVPAGNEAELPPSNTLREIPLPLVSGINCKEVMDAKLDETEIRTDIQFCAGFLLGGKDACKGDSGGPLMVERNEKFVVVGIVSFSVGCGQPDTYGVYTKVPEYVRWIKNITGITP